MDIKVYGFYKAFDGLVKALEKARDSAAPIYSDALRKWAQTTATRGVELLNRPQWLLSRAIASKIKAYDDARKLWGMAGFKYLDDRGPRDPGFYGQFHEAGIHHAGVRSNAPNHFLKRAKQETRSELEELIKTASAKFRNTFQEEYAKARQALKSNLKID